MLCALDLKFCQFYMEQKSVESNRAALALHIRVNPVNRAEVDQLKVYPAGLSCTNV